MERSFIDERSVGQARIAVISAGVIAWKAAFNVPRSEWLPAVGEADLDGRLVVGTNFILVRVGGSTIVVDPCVWHPEQVADWSTVELVHESPGLDEALTLLNVRPEDVSHVLLTHAHLDHCSGVAVSGAGGYTVRFPRAIHIMNSLEWSDLDRQPRSKVKDVLQPVADSGRLRLIEGTYDVGDGIKLAHAPGETPGHSIVQLSSNSESFYYVGDLFHLPMEFVHVDWIPDGRDLESTIASRTWLIDQADESDARVVFTHSAFPGWGRVKWSSRPVANWTPV